ncbi:MAG: sulfatase-like hydrolase/transferase [Saprospiraceae bacterium]
MLKFIPVALFLGVFSSNLAAQQNTILIIADDLGTDYCGFYDDGLDTAKMPNIRSLLQRGVRFTQAWSYPLCSPARASMLTGRFPFRTGVGTVIVNAQNAQLDTAEISIPKLLKTAAPVVYATANIGKWHLHVSTAANRNNPKALGFDRYSGMFIGQTPNYYSWQKIVDGAVAVTVNNYATTELVDDALDWLQSLDPAKPFFLWQAFNAPHSPFHLPPPTLHSVPGLTGTDQHITQNRPEYYKAMIEAMDTEIGRLLLWLDDHNLRDSTNIIFVGDNGDNSQICQFPNANQAKGTIYQNGVHVPMIISGPAVHTPNRTSAALVSSTDLFATVLDISGAAGWKAHIPASKPVDAVSLAPILSGEKTAVRDWVFTEIFDPMTTLQEGKAIRDTAYKLLHFDNGHQEFYHLALDRFEQKDLLLSVPLGTEAQAHYTYLCNTLSNLVGTTACLSSVGTADLDSEQALILAPNPATTTLTVGLAEVTEAVSTEIFDLSGRQVLTVEQAGAETLDVSALPPGLYFLKTRTVNGQVFVGRFVKN